MSRTALLIPVAAALCLAGAPAHAAYDRPSLRVVTGDLDLSSARDVQRLYERLYEAAIVACGGGPLVYFVAGPPEQYLACRNATWTPRSPGSTRRASSIFGQGCRPGPRRPR